MKVFVINYGDHCGHYNSSVYIAKNWKKVLKKRGLKQSKKNKKLEKWKWFDNRNLQITIFSKKNKKEYTWIHIECFTKKGKIHSHDHYMP